MEPQTVEAMTGRKNTPETFPEGDFGETVLALRKRAGLTQSQAATACGLERRETFADWERGKTVPMVITQRAIVSTLRALVRKAKPAG